MNCLRILLGLVLLLFGLILLIGLPIYAMSTNTYPCTCCAGALLGCLFIVTTIQVNSEVMVTNGKWKNTYLQMCFTLYFGALALLSLIWMATTIMRITYMSDNMDRDLIIVAVIAGICSFCCILLIPISISKSNNPPKVPTHDDVEVNTKMRRRKKHFARKKANESQLHLIVTAIVLNLIMLFVVICSFGLFLLAAVKSISNLSFYANYFKEENMIKIPMSEKSNATVSLYLKCSNLASNESEATLLMGTGYGPTAMLLWEYLPKVLMNKRWEVCIFDHIGFGWSDGRHQLPNPRKRLKFDGRQNAWWTMELVKAAGDRLRRTKDHPLFLAQHSFMGYSLIWFAYQYPSFVDGVIFIDPLGIKEEYENSDYYWFRVKSFVYSLYPTYLRDYSELYEMKRQVHLLEERMIRESDKIKRTRLSMEILSMRYNMSALESNGHYFDFQANLSNYGLPEFVDDIKLFKEEVVEELQGLFNMGHSWQGLSTRSQIASKNYNGVEITDEIGDDPIKYPILIIEPVERESLETERHFKRFFKCYSSSTTQTTVQGANHMGMVYNRQLATNVADGIRQFKNNYKMIIGDCK